MTNIITFLIFSIIKSLREPNCTTREESKELKSREAEAIKRTPNTLTEDVGCHVKGQILGNLCVDLGGIRVTK